MKNCPNCQTPLEDDAVFCASCGAKMEAEAPATEAPATEAAETPVAKKKKKWLVPVIIAAVVVVLIAIFAGGSSVPEGATYIADDALFFTDYGKKPTEITDDPAGSGAMISENGKYLFYAEENDNGSVMYVKKFNSLDKDGTKIDTGIDVFMMTEDGSYVFYTKDSNLYKFNVKKAEKSKIKSDVVAFNVSPDGDTLYYVTSDDDGKTNLYLWGKKESKKIASDASVEKITEDYKTIYFTITDEDTGLDTLYKSIKGKEKVKVASDVESVIKIYDSGEVYYVETDEEREDRKLCYFDGKKKTEICKDAFEYKDYGWDKPILVYSTWDDEAEPDDEGKIDVDYMIAYEAKISKITTNNDDAHRFYISPDDKTLYYIDKVDEDEGTGELFSAKIGKSLGKAKSVAKEVVTLGMVTDDFDEDSKGVLYWYNKDHDLYLDGKFVDYAVSELCGYSDKTKTLYFVDEDGALKSFKGKKTTSIADEDWIRPTLTPAGDFLFIGDVSEKSGKGTLNLWTGKKAKALAEDVSTVSALIPSRGYTNIYSY